MIEPHAVTDDQAHELMVLDCRYLVVTDIGHGQTATFAECDTYAEAIATMAEAIAAGMRTDIVIDFDVFDMTATDSHIAQWTSPLDGLAVEWHDGGATA